MIPNITTFEQACTALSLNPATVLPDVSGMPTKMGNAITATAKLYIITKALNGGEDIIWGSDKLIYTVYWNFWWNENMVMQFIRGGVDQYKNQTFTTSLLCFQNYELALHACIHFRDLYNDLLNPQS